MLKRIILFPLLIPHLVCFFLSKKKQIINEDIEAWRKYRKNLREGSHIGNLISLLVEQKDFRAQFYLRIGRVSVFLRLLLPDIKCYSFEGCEIGGGWVLIHGYGVVLNGYVRIGRHCTMYHGVTIGVANDLQKMPVIGDNVFIGAGAKILGGVHVGNHVKIGAGAIVVEDVPDDSTVVNVKAKIINK